VLRHRVHTLSRYRLQFVKHLVGLISSFVRQHFQAGIAELEVSRGRLTYLISG